MKPRTWPEGAYCVIADRRVVEDPDSLGELWREVRDYRREQRDAALPEAIAEITGLTAQGHTVRALTPHQYRVDGVIDLYPARRRFVVVAGRESGRRGTYESAAVVVRKACLK